MVGQSDSSFKKKRKPARHQFTYRFIDSIPLRDPDEDLLANWLEITDTNEDGKIRYHNTWFTSHPVTAETVADLLKADLARWKILNEHTLPSRSVAIIPITISAMNRNPFKCPGLTEAPRLSPSHRLRMDR